MGRTVLVTDSSACIPPGAAEVDLEIVPITIHLADGDVRGDPADLAERVYDALARDEPVKSSAPSPLEYLEVIERSAPDEAIVITLAAELTVMYRNACVAGEFAGCPVTVVDSRSAAAAHGLVVLDAAAALAGGASAEEVRSAATLAASRARLVAALERIDFVRRSGRVSSLALGFAEQLGIRPVFRLQDGAVDRLGVPRSERAALRRIVQEANVGGLRGAERTAVFHAARPERADTLRSMIGGADFITEFSPSMGIHTGPGVVGVAWLAARG